MTEKQPPRDDTLDYSQSKQELSGLALTALIVGILSLPLTFLCGLGLFVGILAVIVGSLALHLIRAQPHLLKGRGIARAGIIMGILAIPLSGAVWIPALLKARELAKRSACQVNLRFIVQDLGTYASANGGAFPVLPFAPYGGTNAGTSSTTLQPDAKASVNALYAAPGLQTGSPLASIWILVLEDYANPKQFAEPYGSTFSTSNAPGGDYYANFQADDQIGYSVAYPYTQDGKVGNWWKSSGDVSLPLMADIAPLAGTGKPRSDPAAPTRAANSGNHWREGQNVLFADGHAEFLRNPQVGHANDNIYTASGTGTPDPAGKAPVRGPITGHGGVPGAYDIIMVPARNLDTGKLW